MRYISKFKTPFINSGAIQVLTLNTSVISFCRFHWWKVVELPLLSSSSKDESKSLTITRKALSWSLFMRAFSLRLRNIPHNWTIWKVTNYERIHYNSFLHKTHPDRGLIFWLDFYDFFWLLCSLKFSFCLFDS